MKYIHNEILINKKINHIFNLKEILYLLFTPSGNGKIHKIFPNAVNEYIYNSKQLQFVLLYYRRNIFF